MLAPQEFSVGHLADAPAHTLMLPRGRYDHTMLIIPVEQKRHAIILSEDHRFESFECGDNTYYGGLLVSGLRYEIDPTSIYDPQRDSAVLGSLVRRADHLAIFVRPAGGGGFGHQILLPIIGGLEKSSQTERAAFRRWRIVLGEHPHQRVLLEVES